MRKIYGSDSVPEKVIKILSITEQLSEVARRRFPPHKFEATHKFRGERGATAPSEVIVAVSRVCPHTSWSGAVVRRGKPKIYVSLGLVGYGEENNKLLSNFHQISPAEGRVKLI